VRSLQYGFALLFLFVAVFAGGPLGCDMLAGAALSGLTAPQTPQAAPEAPDVQAPQAPEGVTEDKDGACCIRRAESAEKACPQGQDRCCTAKYDSSKCEEMNGSWFRSARDCSMMC
jgi:hypothetical protein